MRLMGSEGERPRTLAIDVGGSGIKATVLAADGTMLVDRVRVETTYPMPPDRLVDAVVALVAPLPEADRGSVGFPGMLRDGVVLTAPTLSTAHGPGTKQDPDMVTAWHGFELANRLSAAIGVPFRAANDADVQGSAVVQGKGVEMVVTLGTGFGTALFEHGRLLPHLELAHHPVRDNLTYDEYIGDVARKTVGNKRWTRRVRRAVAQLDALVFFDHLYVGGGNAKRLTEDLGDRVTIVDNTAGLLGGIALWERTAHLDPDRHGG